MPDPEELSFTGVTGGPPWSERFTGELLDAACGDALGAPIEFLSKDEAVRRYGRMVDLEGGAYGGRASGRTTPG